MIGVAALGTMDPLSVLSPRTVGAHLYRVFPKLGVASRGELHHALARENTPVPARA